MDDTSRIRQDAGKLIRERYRLENQNFRIRHMLKGSLIKHYKKCGSKSCACREGNLHGPYWYLSYKEGAKSSLKYVHPKDLVKVERLAGNYKMFQSNLARINKINAEVRDLMGKLRALLLSEKKEK